jgi:hypothetical protein
MGVVRLPITSPVEPGSYLLVLDVLTPGAACSRPWATNRRLVRVVVVAPEPSSGAAPS